MRLLRLAIAALIAASAFTAASASDNAAAIALYREKKTPEARAAFEQLTAADPTNAEAFHFLGLIALREKRDDDAVRLHETATTLSPANSAYFIALGDAYGRKASSASLFSKLTWAKKCLAALETSVALDPRSVAANAALIEYYRRAPGMAGGGMDKAYAQAEKFKALDLLSGTQLLGALYRRESKFTELFALLDAALGTHPDHYPTLLAYGRASAESGQELARGVAALERCLTLSPPRQMPGHASCWVYLGQIHSRQNDSAEARAAYETALKLEPGHREATEALARLDEAAAR
jgi:predicted Zn-dependent protease